MDIRVPHLILLDEPTYIVVTSLCAELPGNRREVLQRRAYFINGPGGR